MEALKEWKITIVTECITDEALKGIEALIIQNSGSLIKSIKKEEGNSGNCPPLEYDT